MPITINLVGILVTFGVLAGLSLASGSSMEGIAVAVLLGVALCGSSFIFWHRQTMPRSGIGQHLAGWVLPLTAAVVIAYLWII